MKKKTGKLCPECGSKGLRKISKKIVQNGVSYDRDYEVCEICQYEVEFRISEKKRDKNRNKLGFEVKW